MKLVAITYYASRITQRGDELWLVWSLRLKSWQLRKGSKF
ncbi:hypothetical protein M2350_001201 [Candidatus Fervidibacter sacchari]|uniref:Uncharacterized protein n=1 Tax=Candidatus Fervidibacter sacchari TaxID=1448929 RepID=A0ABT2ELM3_9BACT|nr:hypothetical protein [Candidatus Fervidibacter sacchari]